MEQLGYQVNRQEEHYQGACAVGQVVGQECEQSPEPAGSYEDDLGLNKDDQKDWMESGSDEDDLSKVLDMVMSQDTPDTLTQRNSPLLLVSGRQGGVGDSQVHDNGHSPVSSVVDGDVVVMVDKPTMGQTAIRRPKQSRLLTSLQESQPRGIPR